MTITGITARRADELERRCRAHADDIRSTDAWRWKELADALHRATHDPAAVIALPPATCRAAAAGLRAVLAATAYQPTVREAVALAEVLTALEDAGGPVPTATPDLFPGGLG